MLSDTKLKNVKPKERGFRLADDRGLCVLVQPSGSKLFQLRYRHLNKQRIYSIGSYPDVSLAQAREMREQVRKLIAQGIDPVEHRRLSGRGRDTGYPMPPAQIRTCSITAYGSCLRS